MGITLKDINDESQLAVEKDFKSIFSDAKEIFRKKVQNFSDEEKLWIRIDELWDRVDDEDEDRQKDIAGTFKEAVKKASNERLIGERNNILSIEFLEKGIEVKRSIGIVNYPLGSGTGVFVGNGIILTNHHVLSDQINAHAYEFQLGFEQNRIGERVEEAYFELAPDKMFITNEKLDFTLVAVGKSNNNVEPNSFGFLTPKPKSQFCNQGDSVSIIHHPNGNTKSVSLHDSIFVSNANSEFHATYTGDTLKGSSGAPVFDQDWNFVALHRSGVVKKNNKGELLKKDGSIFASIEEFEKNQHKANWEANLGTWCDKIIEYLKSKSLSDLNQQQKLEELLALWGAN